jgi:zinc protease
MRSLNDKQLAGAAARYVRPDEVVWLVIGDLRKVEPGIRKLGWGEVTVLDADGKPVR